MHKAIIIGLLFSIASCHSVKLDNTCYKKSHNITELSSVGRSCSKLTGYYFDTKAFPELRNKVRVDVKVNDFNKKTKVIYNCKAKSNKLQTQKPLLDSLPVKKQYAIVTILDKAGWVNEINADYNKDVRQYLIDGSKPKLVNSVGVTITTDQLVQLQKASSFYIKSVDQKYQLLLVDSRGKETGSLDVFSNVILGYRLSKICWAEDKHHNWYVGDIIPESASCKGNTTSCIKKKKSKKLYKL